MSGRRLQDERGAALIVVLLLVATLSFVVLSISERVSLAAARATNERARSAALWVSVGAEALAEAALKAAASETPGVMSLEEPWVDRPLEAPLDGGAATLWLTDATRCFNLNSLVVGGDDGRLVMNEAGAEELAAVLSAFGEGAAASGAVIAAIADWIDADSFQEPQGAEDGYYLSLPTPYRSGGTLLADESEIRAISGVTAEVFTVLKPLVCTHPSAEGSPINVNMLRPAHAPLLTGLLKGQISTAEALSVIADRPPAGYKGAEEFWAHPAFQDAEIPEPVRQRVRFTSRYIEVRAEIVLDGARLNATMMFEVDDGGETRLISRRLGPEV